MEEIQFPLLDLVDDLLIEVFEQLHLLSENSLRACSAACLRFYKLAVPIVYRSVLVRNNGFDLPPCIPTRRLYKDGSRLPSFAREAVFDDRYAYGNNSGEPFVRFLSKAKNLRKITWFGSYQIPEAVLRAVEANLPHVQIELQPSIPPDEEDYYRGWGTSIHEMSGFASRQLTSFRLAGWVGDSEEQVSLRCVSQILTGCPNLRVVERHFSLTTSRYHMPLDLDIRRSDRVPRLNRLCWINLSPSTLDIMTSLGAWENLKVLMLHGTSNLSAFRNIAPLLETLVVYSPKEDPAHLLRFDAPLRKIVMFGQSETQLPVDFLNGYGDTLTELRLRPRQALEDYLQDIPPADVRKLAIICPRLRVLEIHVRMNGHLPYGHLNALAQFVELTDLTLNIQKTAGRRSEDPIEPTLPPDFCTHLTQYLQSKKRGVGLQTITLNARCDSRYHDEQALGYRPEFECRISRNGSISTQRLEPIPSDYEVFRKMQSLTYNLWRQERPFLAEFGHAGRDDLMWVVKRLGAPSGWARNELLPQGLITREQLEGTQRLCSQNLKDEVAQGGAHRKRLRQMVKDELLWLKRRRDYVEKHGEDCTLFDILLSTSGELGWEVLEFGGDVSVSHNSIFGVCKVLGRRLELVALGRCLDVDS